ncbi:MAG: M24 family metallopeptidase [Kiritimatiellae bacterium]|nr:M24 family metallopeptidase [Kiritimatiellia bacterium]
MKKLTRSILLIRTPVEASNLRYVTGSSAPDPAVFLQRGKHKYLVVSVLELGRAKQTTSGIHIVTPQDICSSKKKRRDLSEWALALLKQQKIKKVWVSDFFPLGIAKKLEHAGIQVVVSTRPLFPNREIKTDDEIKHIQQVQKICVKAMRKAIETLQQSSIDSSGYLRNGKHYLTSEHIRTCIEMVLLKHDCNATDTLVACGRQGADPHERGSGPLQAGKPIVIDIFPQHKEHGYWGDITRTVIKGPASDELKKMYNTVRAAQTAALKKVKPGVQCDTIHKEVIRVFEDKGYKTKVTTDQAEGFIHSTGHGVGLDIHEAPLVGPVSTKLRKGHVITIEPGLYYYDKGGIRIEDTVLVTSTGWKYLAPCIKQFEIFLRNKS